MFLDRYLTCSRLWMSGLFAWSMTCRVVSHFGAFYGGYYFFLCALHVVRAALVMRMGWCRVLMIEILILVM